MNFSFKYNSIPSSELDMVCVEDENTVKYTLPDGLVITQLRESYDGYDAEKWVQYLSYEGEGESGLITELFDCDITLPFDPDEPRTKRNPQSTWESDAFRVVVTNGSNARDDDFLTKNRRLFEGEELREHCTAGRSCMGTAPFFDINRQDKGMLLGIGWTGQWHAFFNRGKADCRIRTGIQNVSFRMRRGEKFRTASTLLMRYSDGQDNAHNKWRRLIKEHFSLIGREGREKACPVSAIFWGGVPSEVLIKRWSDLIKCGLRFDYCWIDAGWMEGLSSETMEEQLREWIKLCSWRVNKKYHPRGYLDVVKFLRENNIKLMLWHEPERINTESVWTRNYLETKNPDYSAFHLLNLASKEGVRDAVELISHNIEALGLSCYRQDFNYPVAEVYWWENDDEDRHGITEIKYINGLYEFWDTLLLRFPHLLIDNCASGGHRIDIETLCRSVPLWRSDSQCTWDLAPEANQLQNTGAGWWFPYSGIGYGPTLGDIYSFRSAYTNGLTIRTWEHVGADFDVHPREQNIEVFKTQLDEFMSIRHLLAGDYYRLTPPSTENTSWCVSQYEIPEDGEGILLAFRRASSPYEYCDVKMGGLIPNAQYEFEDADTREKFTSSEKELKNGLRLRIDTPRASRLIRYRAVKA